MPQHQSQHKKQKKKTKKLSLAPLVFFFFNETKFQPRQLAPQNIFISCFSLFPSPVVYAILVHTRMVSFCGGKNGAGTGGGEKKTGGSKAAVGIGRFQPSAAVVN
jgi:hypothetical protein